jgi:hypothetical protein
MLRIAPRKQPGTRAHDAPVRPQDVQQLHRQHGITLAAALAARDPNHHALAVDVAHLKGDDFGQPQACRIGRGQRRASFEPGNRFEETHHFLAAEHHRQPARRARIGDQLHDLAALEGDPVKETQRAHGLVQARPRNALRRQVDLIRTDLFGTEPIRRPAEMFAELCNRTHV